MWTFLFQDVAPILGTFAVGVLGWIGANFVGKQLISFYELRARIHEELFFTDNVKLGYTSEENLKRAQGDLRRLAARLSALNVSITWPTREFLVRYGYDIEKASKNLTGVSNTIDRRDSSIALTRHELEKALILPLSMSDEEIVRVTKQISEGR